MTHICATHLAGKKQSETALTELKVLAVTCLVKEVLDLYFCGQTNFSDAAESPAVDWYC